MDNPKSKLCRSCGECCKSLVLPLEKPVNYKLQKSMVEWLGARGVEIIGENIMNYFVKINQPCQHLAKSGDEFSCGIYEKRPEGCRIFDGTRYDFLKCAWKTKDNFVILEKSIKCPMCGKTGVQMGSRVKQDHVWVRKFRCSSGHIFEEVQ